MSKVTDFLVLVELLGWRVEEGVFNTDVGRITGEDAATPRDLLQAVFTKFWWWEEEEEEEDVAVLVVETVARFSLKEAAEEEDSCSFGIMEPVP